MHTALVLFALLQGQGAPASAEPAKAPAAQAAAPAPQAAGFLEVGGTRISIYGILRMDAYWGDARLNHTQFSYWANSHDDTVTPAVNDEDEWIDWTPRLSRLGIRAERDTLPFWESAKVQGVLEFDFQNRATSETGGLESESRELPRLRHGFVKVSSGSFSALAGQTWDLISPLWPGANADGMMWNAGNLGDRRPQIRFGWDEKVFDGTFNAAVAFARTGAVDLQNLEGAGTDTMRDGDDSAAPMIQGRIGLASVLDKRLDLGVWGHIGWEETQQPVGGEDEFTTSSVGLDVKIKILDTLTLAGEVWQGKNLSDLRGGIGQGVNAALGEEIASRGGWVELAWKAAAWLTLAGGVALDDPDDDDLSSGNRDKNTAPFAWGKVDLGGGFGFGLEWIQWDTEYVVIDDGTANRFSFFVTLAF